MIDFHSHVLPGIDDGSRSVSMTRELLDMEIDQGVDCVIATPHFYAQKESISRFLEKRAKAWEQVQENIPDVGTQLDLRLGAEVYYFTGIGKGEQIHSLCIEGTDVLLLEMPFAQWTEGMLREVRHLLQEQELQIVLAHVERFFPFQKNKDVWNRIMELPVYKQINGGAFFHWKSRRFGLKLFDQQEDILLGSDCHNLTSRIPNLLEAREVIQKKAGADALTRVDQLGERLLHI